MRGKISASTTTSARSTLCLAICDRQLHTWRLSGASMWLMSFASSETAPASTTVWGLGVSASVFRDASVHLFYESSVHVHVVCPTSSISANP